MHSTGFTPEQLLIALQRVHRQVRATVVAACEKRSFAELTGAAEAVSGDTVYAIDRLAEETLVAGIEQEIACHEPVALIGEGLPAGKLVLPQGANEAQAPWRIIADPIDGTRAYMYQKRSGWIVTGAARYDGHIGRLSQIEVAVQTELPLIKQHLCDEFWATHSQGAHGQRVNRFTSECESLTLQPAENADVAHGYITVCSFFAGGRDVLGEIVDELSNQLLVNSTATAARIFEDQHGSTAGQLAGLMTGQDNVVADVRPLLAATLRKRGESLPHCCHPYDLGAKLIAEEAGVLLSAADGSPLDAPLDVETNVGWIGYANSHLRALVEPALLSILHAKMQ